MSSRVVRLGTWNCQMGFARKARRLEELELDIAIVQECSERDWAVHGPEGGLWFGSNPRKGLGVGSPSGAYTLEAAGPPSFRWLVPLSAEGPMPFNLLATWSFNHRQPGVRRLFSDALTEHASVFAAGPTVVAGDFNDCVIWDTPRRPHHRQTVERLRGYGLMSAYHAVTRAEYGEEPDPTLWMYRHEQRAYHIDYVYVPEAWLPRLCGVAVGSYAGWARDSDHAPVVVGVGASSPP
jgi:hypothetical protein